MTDASFCEQLVNEKEQNSIKARYNVPLPRFTPNNPYLSGQFTKTQLDMRRKVEILKYSANKSSTQTNNLTKNQKFALLVRGAIPSPKPTNSNTNSNTNTECSADKLIPRPTTSSDVPGPVMYLYEDDTVPLYNYSDFNTRSYPDYVPNNLDPWQFIVLKNVLSYNNNDANAYYLIINSYIENSQYKYTVTTPIGITVGGIIPAGSDFSGNVFISLQNVSLNVYYNGGLVGTFQAASVANFNMTIRIPSNSTNTSVSFSATQFIGNVSFPNMILFTEPNYVYTIGVNAGVSISPDDTGLFTSKGTITNITSDRNVVQGCTMVSHTGVVNPGASIVSV